MSRPMSSPTHAEHELGGTGLRQAADGPAGGVQRRVRDGEIAEQQRRDHARDEERRTVGGVDQVAGAVENEQPETEPQDDAEQRARQPDDGLHEDDDSAWWPSREAVTDECE